MKNLFALIGALVVGFAVAGWYLGWYQLGFTRTSDGNLRVETNVNTKKVVDDSGEALKKAGAFVGDHLDKTAADASSSAGQQPAPAATPAPPEKDAKVSIFGIDLTPKK